MNPQPKRRPKALDKRASAATKATDYLKVCAVVKAREKGRCRLCGKAGYEAHHVVFRSQGGKDVASNLVLVCRQCHDDIHARIVKLAGDASHLRVGRWTDTAETWQWRAA